MSIAFLILIQGLLQYSKLSGSRTPILTLFYRLHIFHAFMLKKLSIFFVERIKFVDFFGWMHFQEG